MPGNHRWTLLYVYGTRNNPEPKVTLFPELPKKYIFFHISERRKAENSDFQTTFFLKKVKLNSLFG